MKVFVAGGTGVLGREVLRALAQSGHRVRACARSAAKAGLLQTLGAEPVLLDLYDRDALRHALAGCDALLRLTTKIPPLAKMRARAAWRENNRLRSEGARILVDAALSERVPFYVHESVTFVYADGGRQWLIEDAPTDDGGTEILRATLAGEQQAARFSESGGRGIVLRFAGFYSAESSSVIDMVGMVRRRMLPKVGPGTNYLSSIYVADAARAVVAALDAPAGIYNVSDDDPVTFADYLRILAESVHAPQPLRLPGALGGLLFGDVWKYFSRSLRVSSARLKQATGWKPSVPSVREGWPMVAAALAGNAG